MWVVNLIDNLAYALTVKSSNERRRIVRCWEHLHSVHATGHIGRRSTDVGVVAGSAGAVGLIAVACNAWGLEAQMRTRLGSTTFIRPQH